MDSEKYKVCIEVTNKELQDGLYGNVGDIAKVFDKVLEEAKKQGFKEK